MTPGLRRVLLVAVAVAYGAVVVLWFHQVVAEGASACQGAFTRSVPAPLLFASGLPALLAAPRTDDGPLPRRMLLGTLAALSVGYLSLWFPWTYTAGVCVEPGRVTRVRMLDVRAVDLSALDSVRRDRTPTADRFVLGDLVVPLWRSFGRGGFRDPDAVAASLAEAFHEAGGPR